MTRFCQVPSTLSHGRLKEASPLCIPHKSWGIGHMDPLFPSLGRSWEPGVFLYSLCTQLGEELWWLLAPVTVFIFLQAIRLCSSHQQSKTGKTEVSLLGRPHRKSGVIWTNSFPSPKTSWKLGWGFSSQLYDTVLGTEIPARRYLESPVGFNEYGFMFSWSAINF